ncbi:hypothetical protein [Anaerotruncus rubiinfantis]|uniref:hypothetical protein n=1 Tax=Anaerotruncus rubiinfantis TaxID=1720200 RepID=UPI00083202C9|nr:hypothetical protein [Anaerotruncus rubiinfantis]
MKRWTAIFPIAVLIFGAIACSSETRGTAPISEESGQFAPAVEEYEVYDGGLGVSLEIPTELKALTESDGTASFQSEKGDLVCTVTAYKNADGKTPAQVMKEIPFQYGDITLSEEDRMTRIGVGDTLDGQMAHVVVSPELCVSIVFCFEASRLEACQKYFEHALETLSFS